MSSHQTKINQIYVLIKMYILFDLIYSINKSIFSILSHVDNTRQSIRQRQHHLTAAVLLSVSHVPRL